MTGTEPAAPDVTVAAATIDAYVAAWNCADPARRAALLASCWAPGATYVDPTVHLRGAAELDAHVAGLHERRPGAVVEIVGGVAVHHGWACFAWRVLGADGRVGTEGVDTVELGPDGRLRRVVGFFGGVPPWPREISGSAAGRPA